MSSNVESIGGKFAEDLEFRVHVFHRTGLRAALLKHGTLPTGWMQGSCCFHTFQTQDKVRKTMVS